jgi:hypothetical protein
MANREGVKTRPRPALLLLALVCVGSLGLVAPTAVPAAPRATAADCLRFGVYPGNTFTVGKYAGLGGTGGHAVHGPEAMAAMEELAGGRAFDVHFYASWRSGVPAETVQAMREVVARGMRVNLALKYLPPAGRNGDIEGFAAWVADVVRNHPEVTTVQVTNEANSGASSDSDGGSADPLGALIEGVKAAAAVKAPHQEIGFNWFYRLDPVSDRQFWSTLGERGGDAFREAVDWAGVDIYAGTYVPPVSVDDEGDFRAALEYTRHELSRWPASAPRCRCTCRRPASRPSARPGARPGRPPPSPATSAPLRG